MESFFPFSCESFEIKKGEMTGKVGKKQKKPENNEKAHVFPSCVGPVSSTCGVCTRLDDHSKKH